MLSPDCFGGEEWRKYFGVDVGNPQLPRGFFSWWTAPDAIDPTKYNYETHLDPIWRPDIVSEQPYDLETLTRLAAAPQGGGHPTPIDQDSEAFRQHARTPAGPGCWLAVRRNVVARNRIMSNKKQLLIA